MNYAIVENGLVINIIVGPLPFGMDGISISDRPVAIGDAYENGFFLRDGVVVLTDSERIQALEAEILALQQQLEA